MALVTAGHNAADGRLHRLVAAFRAAGLTVELRALGDAGDAPTGVGFVGYGERSGFARRLVRSFTGPMTANARVIVVPDPDAVFGGWLARTIRGRALVVDVHEDYLALLADRTWARGPRGVVASAIARTALAVSRLADLVVVVDDALPPSSARARMVVPNTPYPDLLPAPSPRADTPRALYVGDVRASRGLWTMLTALELSSGWELDVVGPVAAADREGVAQWQRTSSAAGRVRWHGRRPPPTAWQPARGSWLGLSVLDDTPAFRRAVPTKLFEYAACGLPVLVSDLPRQAQLVRAHGFGLVVSDAADLARALNHLADHPDELTPMVQAGLSWAADQGAGAPYDELAARVAALAGRSAAREMDR